MIKIIDKQKEINTYFPFIARHSNGLYYLYSKDYKTQKISYINLSNGNKFDTDFYTIDEVLKNQLGELQITESEIVIK